MKTDYVPERVYVKLPRDAALAIRAIAEKQEGELRDPRKVVTRLLLERLVNLGVIERELPEIKVAIG